MMLFKFFNVEINEFGINLNLEDSIESKQGQEVESVYVYQTNGIWIYNLSDPFDILWENKKKTKNNPTKTK